MVTSFYGNYFFFLGKTLQNVERYLQVVSINKLYQKTDRVSANNFVSLISSLCVGLGHYSKALSDEILFFLIFSCFNEIDKVRAASPVHIIHPLIRQTLSKHWQSSQARPWPPCWSRTSRDGATCVLEHACPSKSTDLQGNVLFKAPISPVLDSELITALFLESRWLGNPPHALGQGDVCIMYGLYA